MKKKALMTASVASMIDLFNMDNIHLLQSLGYQVEVAANFAFGSITSQERVDAFRGELEAAGIRTYHVPIPRSISDIKDIISSYRAMKRLCEEGGYTLMHTQSPIGGVVARMAAAKQRKAGMKVIYTAHGFHFFRGAPKANWLLFYPIEKFFSRVTDVLITINQEDFARAGKFHAGKTVCVPGIGIDLDKFAGAGRETPGDSEAMQKDPDGSYKKLEAMQKDPDGSYKKLETMQKDPGGSHKRSQALPDGAGFSSQELQALRDEFGFLAEDYVLLSLGQLSHRKNQETVIRAVARLADKQIKYLIVGAGELEAHDRKLIRELQIEDRVILAGYRGDVPALMHMADCFVFPSKQEGLPVALMEAMASGIPVICSKIRGNTDLIADREQGILVEPEDGEGFAKAIVEMKNDPAFARRCAMQAKTKVKDFGRETVQGMMREIYESVES